MHVGQLKDSKFLKKEDVGTGALCTISGVGQENVAKEGAPEELKWCLYVEEFDKPMVLNSTNGQIIAGVVGSEETDDWTGHQVVLYHDPNVSFSGKLVGGIRVRAPKPGYKVDKQAANKAKHAAKRSAVVDSMDQGQAPEPENQDGEDDNLPF